MIWISKTFYTEQAIINLIENIEKVIDNKLLVGGIFIDLQKEFDIVDHNVLIHELTNYGIRDLGIFWFFSCLSRRK